MDVTFAVRSLHVLAATLAVGIPIGLALVLHARPEPAVVERLVTPVERAQWVALALLLVTGIGNLQAFEGVLPEGDWTVVLYAKLGVVVALLLISAVRTFLIAGIASRSVPLRRLEAWYALTGAAGLLVVILAEVLAHG